MKTDKLREQIRDDYRTLARELISPEEVPPVVSTTPSQPLTLADYRAHMLGWQAGVSGHQADEKADYQYIIGFQAGRKMRTDYAKSIKARVDQ